MSRVVFVIVVIGAIIIGIFIISFWWSTSKGGDTDRRPSVFIEDKIVESDKGVDIYVTSMSDWSFEVIVKVSGCVNRTYNISFNGMNTRLISINVPFKPF